MSEKKEKIALERSASPSPPPYVQTEDGDAAAAATANAADESGEDEKTDSPGLETISSARPRYEYGLYHTKRCTHIIVTGYESRKPLYFAEVSEFTLRKPDVQLHQVSPEIQQEVMDGSKLTTDQGIAGPIVGQGRYKTLTRDFHIGLINPNQPDGEVTWESVHNEQRIGHGQYDFLFTNPNEPNTPPVKYSWRRTHQVQEGLEGGSLRRKLDFHSWKLINLRTNNIIAFFEANFSSIYKVGKLIVFDGLEKDLELIILLSFCSIEEKRRRRDWKRRSAAGGGGGSGGGSG